jgi:hypothetical protein
MVCKEDTAKMIQKRGFYSYKIQYLKILQVSLALPIRPPEPLAQFAVYVFCEREKSEIRGALRFAYPTARRRRGTPSGSVTRFTPLPAVG